MTHSDAWQIQGSAAELYEKYLVPAITSLWARDLVTRMAPKAGDRVLDVACGTGIVSRLAARQMDGGRVVGLDINQGMLAVARAQPQEARLAVEWCEGSALAIPFPDGSFDLVLCQLGLQFFPDRPLALREMYRVLGTEGRLGLSVYSAIDDTPVASALADALDRHLGPGGSSPKRSEHIFEKSEELRSLVEKAGFSNVEVSTVTQVIRFPSPREYVHLQINATPMAGLVADMDATERESLIDHITHDVVAALDRRDGQELTSPQQAFVVTARRR
jgi:ubiquinone/menaquinone biosynthesis C-methylase UbiE